MKKTLYIVAPLVILAALTLLITTAQNDQNSPVTTQNACLNKAISGKEEISNLYSAMTNVSSLEECKEIIQKGEDTRDNPSNCGWHLPPFDGNDLLENKEIEDMCICQRFRTPFNSWEAQCIANVATKKADISLCSNISNNSKKNECIILYIKSAQEDEEIGPQVCSSFSNNTLKERCLRTVAVFNDSWETCIFPGETRPDNWCVSELILKYSSNYSNDRLLCLTLDNGFEPYFSDGDVSTCEFKLSYYRDMSNKPSDINDTKANTIFAAVQKDLTLCPIQDWEWGTTIDSTCSWLVK